MCIRSDVVSIGVSFTDFLVFFFLFFTFVDNENILSGQLDELASDVAVLVFETDEVPCKDIVRSVKYTFSESNTK